MKYERIRSLRIDRDMTQEQIAEYLNIAQNTYLQYEIGHTNYPIETLIKLARLYHTSIDYLVGETDDPRPYPRAKKFRHN